MRRIDYRTLVDHGRRAGLRTSELYSALGGRPPEGRDAVTARADENGYALHYGEHGERTYEPATNGGSR